jgi:16S rRNA (guanine527-N7)-methyltransferase
VQSSPELTELRGHPQLQAYVALLLEEGDRLGLTAFREPEPIWSELIADSATGASRLPGDCRVLDLGSGGGCPGVVLQVLRPDVKIWLLEANGRKASFLQRVVTELGLPSEVLNDRSETVAHQKGFRGSFDMVVAKAVASLPTLVELSVPLLKVGAHLLAYKGPQAAQEVEQARAALTALGAQVHEVQAYQVGDKAYCHVLVRKIKPTSKQYPRRPGIPAKQPLL